MLALSWSRAIVEQLGLLIRDEARVADGFYRLNEKQVGHILDLRLYQLTGLERESIKSEYDALIEVIKDLLDILAKEKRVLQIIKDELRELQRKYATERRTLIVPAEARSRSKTSSRTKASSSRSPTTASSSAPPSPRIARSAAAARASSA